MNDLVDITIYDYDRNKKIHAVRFLRSLVGARDGVPYPAKEAKAAIDDLESGFIPRIVIERVPSQLQGLINSAAAKCDVALTDTARTGYPRYI